MTRILRLPPTIAGLRTKVDALSLRERILLFAAAVMLMSALWYFAMMQPLAQRMIAGREKIALVRARIEDTNNSLEEQVLQFSSTGGEQQRRFERVQDRIDEIDERLGNYAAELIDPAEMARVLEAVLKQQSKLRLIRVHNLDAEPLLPPDEARTTTLYRHGLEIEFEGDYFACLEYLEDIEALPWRFYWQILDLDVASYPRNRIRLEVSTLSLDEDWIGA